MSAIYKIHPAIGVARVGHHLTAFFVGPERPGTPGVEIAPDNSESPVTQFKKDGQVKRQAARFRVYEYATDSAGNLTLVGEIKSDRAKIEWKVDLMNRKAALDHRLSSSHPSWPHDHPAAPRNGNVHDRSTLTIHNPQPATISGTNQKGVELHGSFLSIQDVYLGELQTDAVGRLMVLGGRGDSESDPAGASLSDFANNDKWHDDVADGPVTATITFPGQTAISVHQPAWVTVAPPDFAPGIDDIVSLFDWTVQAAMDGGMLKPDAQPSFSRHIRSRIERAVSLRWVNGWTRWNALLPLNWTALADPSAASAMLRRTIGARLKSPGLDNWNMPPFLEHYINQWVAGDFVSDLNAPDPVLPEPAALDRAALESCVGAGFFPGIEGTANMTDKDMYVEPGRLNPAATAKVFPGCLTQYMAVPWQADFYACSGGVWWPSQRPDIAVIDGTQIPGSIQEWANPIAGFQGMVKNVQRLGFVVPKTIGPDTVYVEVDRDPGFARQ